MESIVITGGVGFVGSILTERLIVMGYNVICIDNLKFGFNPVLAQFANYDNFHFYYHDFTESFNSKSWKKVEKYIEKSDFVIHLAALVGYPICEKFPELATRLNIDVSKNLTDLCEKYNVKLLYASSGSNYGKIEGVCTEDSAVNPLTHYALTKHEAELYILDNCSSIAYRFATAFGLSPRLRLDLYINDMVYRALSDGSVVAYEPHHRRTFIHVSDMARVYIHGIQNMKNIEGRFNAGDEKLNYTKLQILEKIQEFIPDFFVAYGEYQSDKDQRDYEVSYKKIRSTGFKCETGLDEGIKRLIDFLNLLDLKQISVMGLNNAL